MSPERLSKTEFARALRKGSTFAERELWDRLRDRKLAGFKFTFQFPIDKYIADFCCRSHKLVVEVDGFTHEHHKEKDAERDRVLKDLGYEVLRFTDEEILGDMPVVLLKIADALERRPQFRY